MGERDDPGATPLGQRLWEAAGPGGSAANVRLFIAKGAQVDETGPWVCAWNRPPPRLTTSSRQLVIRLFGSPLRAQLPRALPSRSPRLCRQTTGRCARRGRMRRRVMHHIRTATQADVQEGGWSFEGSSALHWASFHGRLDCAATLLEAGATVDSRDVVSSPPPTAAAACQGRNPALSTVQCRAVDTSEPPRA